MPNDTCTVADCGKPVRSKYLCYAHYMKLWRYGTPTPTFAPTYVDLTGQSFGELTVTARDGKMWRCSCSCGAETMVRTGCLNSGNIKTCGDKVAHYRSDTIGYGAAHERVKADRGPIKTHTCADCGAPAQHWSYDHSDPDELYALGISPNPVAYSVKPEHYTPRCVSCHKRYDLGRIDSASARA